MAALAQTAMLVLLAVFWLLATACAAAPTPLPTSTPSPTPEPPVIRQVIPDFASEFLDNRRPLLVYLPGEYHQQPQARYPVLYANDGQDMGSVDLEKTLNELYRNGEIKKIIVVAIPAASDRLNEYGTAGVANADGLGAKAQAYSDFLLQEVMPYINANFRTLTTSQDTAIMGWSLGGLSAFDIAWRHADKFGVVGVFSGSFWWRSDASSLEARIASRIMHQRIRADTRTPALRMWFEAGSEDEQDDRDGNGVIDAIQDTTELIDELVAKGYVLNQDIVYLEIPGGQHNQRTWSLALPEFLKFAFAK